MQVYILDRSRTRIDMIDEFVSFIWTVRPNAFGDFQLKFAKNKVPSSIKIGNYVEKTDSLRLMEIETIKTQVESDGSAYVIASGRSLEKILMDRIVTPNTTKDYWTLTGTIGWIVRELIRRICVAGTEFSPYDKIDDLSINIYDPSTKSRTVKLETKPLYDTVKDLCAEDDFNFQILFNRATKNFEFTLFRGVDRTDDVIFGEMFDNISTDEFVKSNVDYKNVAYVRSGDMIREVYETTNFSGLSRKVLYVDASDIEEPTASKLDARGRLELSKKNMVRLYTAEVDITKTNIYGQDYSVGDIVSFVDSDGQKYPHRVTESVATYDAEGYRVFPSFERIE